MCYAFFSPHIGLILFVVFSACRWQHPHVCCIYIKGSSLMRTSSQCFPSFYCFHGHGLYAGTYYPKRYRHSHMHISPCRTVPHVLTCIVLTVVSIYTIQYSCLALLTCEKSLLKCSGSPRTPLSQFETICKGLFLVLTWLLSQIHPLEVAHVPDLPTRR